MHISRLIAAVLTVSAHLLLALSSAHAANGDIRSCDSYLPPLRQVGDEGVGPKNCQMHEQEIKFADREFVRVDMGLDGTVEGYVTREGSYREYMTNAPDLVFPQTQASNPEQPILGIATYESLRGTAVLMVYPKDKKDWNGKLWVTAHGRGRSFKNGSLKVWQDYLDPASPLDELNKLEKVMLTLGYAVAVTRRASEEGVGEIVTRLADGSVVDWVAFNDSHSLIKDFTRIAETAVQKRLGKLPTRTYLYGKSAGARLARGMNYLGQTLNKDHKGNTLFDGFLVDDSAAGTWLPVVMKDGKDVLLTTDAEKQAFVPQLELVHQAYAAVNAHDLPDFVTLGFLTNKYNNARILLEKGLGDKFRMYEIRQLSHDDGSAFPEGRNDRLQILDLSLLMEGAITLLDQWVEGVKVAPPSRSDYAVVGDTNQDGRIDNPAISYPEVACPLGVFYPYPESGAGTMSWAAFTGQGLEPLDENKAYVDINLNGHWDFRESPQQAWQRLSLLQAGEELTQQRYISCVTDAASALGAQGFFGAATVKAYAEKAATKNLQPASDEEAALIHFNRF
jgi:hypothetical protein